MLDDSLAVEYKCYQSLWPDRQFDPGHCTDGGCTRPCRIHYPLRSDLSAFLEHHTLDLRIFLE